jgi:hypothetical protein
MEDNSEGLGISLRRTVENSEFSDAIIEAGDLSLEHISAIADHVPILKWVTAAGKTTLAIRDAIFIKKLAAFLADLRFMSDAERVRMMDRLNDEPAYSNRAAEALMTVLDRVDSTLKAKWVAKALRAYAGEEITARQLMRLNAVIERVLVCDVDGIVALLEKQSVPKQADDDQAQSALVSGLAAIRQAGFGGGGIAPTPVYRLFKEYVLDRC